MAVEQLLDGGARARTALLVDLHDQAPQRFLRGIHRGGTGGDDLADIVPTLAEGVDAGVDRDSQGAAGKLLDLATLPVASPCRGAGHGVMLGGSHHVCTHARSRRSTERSVSAGQNGWS